ncbi:MAG: hypothetical protein CMG64_02625 [Candidatus Marinimicrobia bacterium]|nr:hypothetical protein [Candidatus Neomarinimicrobiota bacterium]|tara:strand:- start:15151 stop:16419 length:1269 start_codon:yes stop_codon:yes gene_type:complete
MAVDVIMPKLGESITEATILEWKVDVGSVVSQDETILEISTDKVDSEVPSPSSGKVLEILYKKNDTVPVGEIIARIGEETDTIVSNNKPVEEELKEENEVVESVVSKEKNKANESKNNEFSKSDKFYSPLVRSIAKKENISLEQLNSIKGSGYNGRVNKKDILDYLNSSNISDKPISDKVLTDVYLENKIEPMDHVRKMIAKHMVQSRDTSVHVYSSNEVDMNNIVLFRNKNKENFQIKYNTSLTYTPFILDAVIKAIQEFPLINACLDGDNIKYNQNINMGVAVALPDDNLIVPVIKRSEELNFLGLTRSAYDLAKRARSGQLNPDEAQGSTFTVTNPGVFGSLFGMGIINQPNVAILSVGSIHKRPVVKETEFGDIIVARSMMYLTLAYDHRIIDGAYGTKFLSKIKYFLESFEDDRIKK